MVIEYRRTVWFPRDLLLAIVVYLPIWGLGGVFWGLAMYWFMAGGILLWLGGGAVWGIACWFWFSVFIAIAFREVATTMPMGDPAKVADRLSEAAKPLRYTVEANPPSVFVCRPKRWLARRFECNAVQIQTHDGFLELTGPAMIVKRFVKGLGS